MGRIVAICPKMVWPLHSIQGPSWTSGMLSSPWGSIAWKLFRWHKWYVIQYMECEEWALQSISRLLLWTRKPLDPRKWAKSVPVYLRCNLQVVCNSSKGSKWGHSSYNPCTQPSWVALELCSGQHGWVNLAEDYECDFVCGWILQWRGAWGGNNYARISWNKLPDWYLWGW